MRFASVLCAAVLAATTAGVPGAALAAAPPEAPASLQGDVAAWRNDPHVRLFYEAVVAACADGAEHADVAALEARSRPIFRDMAAAHGMKPDQMERHLAGFPRQMVKIAREDPTILASYPAFLTAVFGPE